MRGMSKKQWIAIPLLCVAAGCGESDKLASTDPYKPYMDANVTVIGGDPSKPVATGQLTSQGCLQVTAQNCVAVQRTGQYCKETSGPADVVVVNGMVKEVVCYSTASASMHPTVIKPMGGAVNIPQSSNGAVLTFDPSTDGMVIPGNVTLDANDVTLYGSGPDKSIIGGDLVITGNNARVRGIRVKGNVVIDLNTAALVLSVVEGNLHLGANNALVAETDVFGNVEASGNGELLVGDGCGGGWQIEGHGDSCDHDFAFMDKNSDKIVQMTEQGAALSCPM
jgi:hypothetical protein